MNIPFLTLEKYAGQVLNLNNAGSGSPGGDHPHQWEEPDQVPSWISEGVRHLFEAKNDALQKVWQLQYPDVNGLGNVMYRLDGETERFFLKTLGDAPGNHRELLVWALLGYWHEDQMESQEFRYIRGLPPKQFLIVDRHLSSILTPFYSGVLKAISGGFYEFPLVLCVLLYLEQTLRALHERGLVYMDLCPSNILFKETAGGFLLFFLTDFGGVKPLDGDHCRRPEFQEFIQSIPARRWTRRETVPPPELFPIKKEEPRIECAAEYDLHTLARTALILLGLGNESDWRQPNLDAFPRQIRLEDPLSPIQEEVRALIMLLHPWLQGEPVSEKKQEQTRTELKKLFKKFFKTRAQFAAEYIDDRNLAARWQSLLEARLLRYKMCISKEYPSFAEELTRSFESQSEGGLTHDLDLLTALTQKLRNQDRQGALDTFRALAGKQLIRHGQWPNYAFHFHARLFRSVWSHQPDLHAELSQICAGVPALQAFMEEPEEATNRSVRAGLNLGDLAFLERRL